MRLTGIGIVAASLLLSGTVSAATLPALSFGERGANVGTMQRLLGYSGNPVAVTERIGSTTENLVKSFQATHGLAVDGVVGPQTWHSLQPILRPGATNSAVKALQIALNEKEGYDLPVTGYFGTMTESAVINFQSHMGLRPDGVVGRNTWDALISHFVELPAAGAGYYRSPGAVSTWGTANTVATLEAVARRWHGMGYRLRIGVNDISRRHGGYFAPHAGHREGTAVDLTLMRSDGREIGIGNWRNQAYNRSSTQQLVNLLRETGEVESILFNDPYVSGVRPWPGHEDHLHVQFIR